MASFTLWPLSSNLLFCRLSGLQDYLDVATKREVPPPGFKPNQPLSLLTELSLLLYHCRRHHHHHHHYRYFDRNPIFTLFIYFHVPLSKEKVITVQHVEVDIPCCKNAYACG
jgi:hypothetical protein